MIGQLYAWGINGDGQLGDGTTVNKLTPVQVHGPDDVGFLTDIIEVDSGRSLAIKSDGTVWAWGLGPLGDGTVYSSLTPVQVHGLDDVGFLTDIIAVSSHYGQRFAIKSDGTLWAWGENYDGELADGTLDDRLTPVQVHGEGDVGFFTDVTAIECGGNHSLALRSDGTVWAWGSNEYGQLGNGTHNFNALLTPIQVHGPDNVGFLTGIKAIACGYYVNFALKLDGTVWGWGASNYGTSGVGDGTTVDRFTPTQVHGSDDIGFLADITTISIDYRHCLALKSDGTVWTWGVNPYGELGIGTLSNRSVPTQVHGLGDIGFLTDITTISSGDHHCLAAKLDGTVWAWGAGPLGDGTVDDHSTPVQILNLPGASRLSAGNTSMAIEYIVALRKSTVQFIRIGK